jgi:hypothetical protein
MNYQVEIIPQRSLDTLQLRPDRRLIEKKTLEKKEIRGRHYFLSSLKIL